MILNTISFKSAALALCLSAFAVSCNTDNKVKEVKATATDVVDGTDEVLNTIGSKIDAFGNYIYDMGKLTNISLPGGITLDSVGDKSTEYKLYDQLKNTDFTVSEDKTQGWISLDRVNFKTGSAELSAESEAQVKNLVSILKAYPGISIKIGGYTDNVGGVEINKKVSTDRAKVFADKLVASGVETSRVASEGYGSNHFVCPANDTDECKAQNRRVDIRVTKK